MILEPGAAFLRYVRLGDREIVRGVYAAVRDRYWRTIVPRVSNVDVQSRSDGFRVSFDVDCHEREVHFAWRGTITGEGNGTVTFAMDGTARSTFLASRIGICVLHPIAECVARPCVVEHVDGTQEEGRFPHHIEPHQPFSDIRAISHEVMPGVRAEVRFEGDAFEMEDQRNWSDASFKTYSRPLRLPHPVELEPGTRIAQSVTLRLDGAVPAKLASAPTDAPEVVFAVSEEPPIWLPHIGLAVASHGQALSPAEIERLKALNLAHLRVDLNLAAPAYADDLQRAAREATALDVPLEVAVFVTDDAEEQLRGFVAALEHAGCRVVHFLIFHEGKGATTEAWVRLARQHLSKYDREARIGAGSNANFTELNRERPPVGALDLVCYAVNPQVHTFDSASTTEALATQAWTVESARQFVGGLPIAVTPVTLKRRVNPHLSEFGDRHRNPADRCGGSQRGPGSRVGFAGMNPGSGFRSQSPNSAGELPLQVDVRQMSLFGAAWTLGSIKYLCDSGARSLTYYETTGWRGVMETQAGSPLPGKFRSIPGAVFPMYHVFADVGEFAGGNVIASRSDAPLRVDGMVLQRGGRGCVLLANMRPEPQELRLVGHGLGEHVRVRRLDEENAEQAMRQPEAFRHERGKLLAAPRDELRLSLRPYAYVRVDVGAC
jgi:hypothetical protein